MPESEEEKKKRWAAAAAMSYMTPAMKHALTMSKQQSQNKYKAKFDQTKGKGYTSVASTPELENAKKQSNLVSQNKYKSEFEKNKAKFTQVADNPELRLANRAGKQLSDIEYHGKGSVISKPRRRKENPTAAANSSPKSDASARSANDVLSHRNITSDPPKEENRDKSNRNVNDKEQIHKVKQVDETANEKPYEVAPEYDHTELVQTTENQFEKDTYEQACPNDIEQVIPEEFSEEYTEEGIVENQVDESESVSTNKHYENSYDMQGGDVIAPQDSDVSNLQIAGQEFETARPASPDNENETEQSSSLDDFYANLE